MKSKERRRVRIRVDLRECSLRPFSLRSFRNEPKDTTRVEVKRYPSLRLTLSFPVTVSSLSVDEISHGSRVF